MRVLICVVALLPLAAAFAECEPILGEADAISKKYTLEMAKNVPPSFQPMTQKCLDAASIWFTIDLSEIATKSGQSTFEALSCEELWKGLREMGVQAVRLKGLKQGGEERTGIGIDQRWGKEEEWDQLASMIQKKGISLIGDLVGGSLGITSDFALALQNVDDYPGLYHLIEIAKEDWKLLPTLACGDCITNVPWLSLQELVKKGYVPEHYSPRTRESDWNATNKIVGQDNKARRWIYLKEGKENPVINWLGPTFAGMRLAAGDALDSFYKEGISFFHLDAKLPLFAQENIPLFIRKLGGFSIQEVAGGIANYKNSTSDLMYDALTRPALLQALVSADAEALRLIYRLLLNANIPMQRLVHLLQSEDPASCEWGEFTSNGKNKYRYYEEHMTGDALKNKLKKQMMAAWGESRDIKKIIPPSTWTGYCQLALKDEMKCPVEKIQEAHLLLAFFYAMQPGAFCFSASDLLGALSNSLQKFDLQGVNDTTLYPSFPIQLLNPHSFAMGLKHILRLRKEYNLESASLIEIPQVCHPGVLILCHKLQKSGFLQILAINFGKCDAQEMLEMPQLKDTTAINLMTNLTENKSFESSRFILNLPPLSGKAILFQPKHF